MKIRFDIIIVSYNAGEKLNTTLKSVLAQEQIAGGTDTDLRVIIKDGDSGDGCIESAGRLLETCPQLIRDRVQILRARDNGIYDAMNAALDACLGRPGHPTVTDTGDDLRLLSFINCGDTYADKTVLREVSERIRTVLASGERDAAHPVICYGDVIEERTKERVFENPRMDDFALYRHIPCHQACFYDAALFLTERFDTTLRVRADYDHFLKCHYRYHARFVHMPIVIARYEGGGFSETRENRMRSKREHRIVLQRYMDDAMIRKFDRRMKLTLQPLRTYLAENPKTASFYNTFRKNLYRIRNRES